MWQLGCFSNWEIIQDYPVMYSLKFFLNHFTSIPTVLLFLNLSVSIFYTYNTFFTSFSLFSTLGTVIFVGHRRRLMTAYDGIWQHMTAYDSISEFSLHFLSWSNLILELLFLSNLTCKLSWAVLGVRKVQKKDNFSQKIKIIEKWMFRHNLTFSTDYTQF